MNVYNIVGVIVVRLDIAFCGISHKFSLVMETKFQGHFEANHELTHCLDKTKQTIGELYH